MILFLALVLTGSSLAQAQSTDLGKYTKCDLGADFQIIQVDGPVTDFAWPTRTKAGETSIDVEVGYRVLVAYKQTEPFGNLKAERLPVATYLSEKSKLLAALENYASQPGMDAKVAASTMNGLNLYGVNRDKLEGGVLSIYNLFDDADHVSVTMYLLNDYPDSRKFSTLDQYSKIRDSFLQSYTACLKKNSVGVAKAK